MPRVADHQIELCMFVILFGLITVLGFGAARWRRRTAPRDDLDEWGLAGRSFGPFVTWFLLSGELYTAFTFVALPAAVFAGGAPGFFAVSFAAIGYPLAFVALTRLWSVSHVHGLVTPGDFVRARYSSPTLALLVAVTGIVATMPYIALQLVGMQTVFATMGIPGHWPLAAAFTALALFTYHSGLRAPALIAIVKDALIACVVLGVLLSVSISATGWGGVFRAAGRKFDATPSQADGLLLPPVQQINYVTLVLGSALALFLYPHAVTGFLAAKNRATVRGNLAMLPVHTLVLGLIALVGFVAVAEGVTPLGADPAHGVPGDRNTVVPRLFEVIFPHWYAGIGYAAIGVSALVPAAVMSIAAANLFTRNVYREFIRPRATPAQEARVGRASSLLVKVGALACVLVLAPQFAIDLQLIGGVIILQTLPAVALGLFTTWLHRHALVAGLVAGLATGITMLYQIPQLGAGGKVVRPHFGGSAWPLEKFGIAGGQSVYVGIVAIAVNLAVAAVATPLLRRIGVPDGLDLTRRRDYAVDEGDASVHRMAELVDGAPDPLQPVGGRPELLR